MKRYRPHILVLCVLVIALLTGSQTAIRNAVSEARFNASARQPSGGIVLVAIDPVSIDKIGVWPWPRQLHAELLDRLASAGAADIVFDVDFSSASNPTSDQAFADALRKAGGSVVLPAFKQLAGNGDSAKVVHVSRPLKRFAEHTWSAVVNVAVEPDGLVRRYSYGDVLDGTFLPSVGALLAGQYDARQEPLHIDFSIAASRVPTVSYVDVLRGDPLALSRLKDKKVIIGATAVELGDRFNVPNGKVISGPVLQILAAESILQGRALHVSSWLITAVGLVFIGVLMLALWSRLSAGSRVVFLINLAAAIELLAFIVQTRAPFSLDTSLFHIAIAAYLVAMALDEIDFRDLLGRIAEKRFHRIAMSLGDGLVCADQNGRITIWNPGAQAIFGYDADEIIGEPLATICAGRDATGSRVPFSILALPIEALQAPGGKILELEGRRKNGDWFPLEACLSEWQGVDGFQYGAVMRDISVRKREAERIRYLAENDTLTGLANRNKLYSRLDAMLAEADATQCELALLTMGLDKFKQINDTLGHACGDQLLISVAERLKGLAGNAGLIARLSGDEFAVVLSSAAAAAEAAALSAHISAAFSDTPFVVGGRQINVNVSIGIASYPKDCRSIEELLGNADLALYEAKAAGRGRAMFFERGIRDKLEQRLALEADLERALARNEFELHYQPQADLKDGRLAGAEVLIRWRHPQRGLVSAESFMPVVNASSIADRLAHWVMTTACRQGRAWEQQGHAVRLGVNLSPCQFQAGDLPTAVATVLKDTGFSPSLLELEVTESILLADDARALDIFRRIQNLGVQIAFDDFGTGYASLTYLKTFPLDRLKIDKSFVGKLAANADDMAIVGATISLGKLLGLSVIAEGIEDRATAELLLGRGCDEGQGYYFGRPMPAAEFEQRFLAKGAATAVGHAIDAATAA